LGLIKTTFLTFSEVDKSMDVYGDAKTRAFCNFRTRDFEYATVKEVAVSSKKRHWLLQRGDIEEHSFLSFLPHPEALGGNPVDLGPLSCSLLRGGDTPEVFESLGQHTSAVVAANVDLINFPFNPVGHAQSHAAIGRCQAVLGRTQEAESAFKTAVAEAQRCNLALLAFFAMKDSIVHAPGNAAQQKKQAKIIEHTVVGMEKILV
jgi:hypothetical protein